VELHPVMFAANPRIGQIYEVIKWQDQCTREDEIVYMRSELPGSGRKLRPQKGTGKARIKDKRAPQFQFGGRPLGRRPRDHGYDIDLNLLVAGFSAICTSKYAQGDFYLVDSLKDFTIPSLLGFKQMINTESVLFVSGYEGLSPSQNTEICFHPGAAICALISNFFISLSS
jgi:ribosomal protein L4